MPLSIPLVTKFDDTGIRKAKKAFGGFGKVIGALGLAAIGAQVADLAKESVRAAAEDLKSQRLLAGQLKKNAGANKVAIKGAEAYIDKLSMQVGIVDDELRPALAKLARATGNTKKAQDLLTLAVDASAASGKPLATVSDALSKAFNGNTTSLTRMFPNLKKSKDLMGDLRKTVGGTAKEIVDPFDKLNVAVDNLKEQFGMKLLPYVTQFVDYLATEVVPQVQNFIDDMSNPNTEVGATFETLRVALVGSDGKKGLVADVVTLADATNDLFAVFDTAGQHNGFANFLKTITDLLGAAVQQISDIFKLVGGALTLDFGKIGDVFTGWTNRALEGIIPGWNGGNKTGLDANGRIPASPTGGSPMVSSSTTTKNQNIKIDVKVGPGVSGDAVGREIVRRIKEYEKSNGSGWRRGSL